MIDYFTNKYFNRPYDYNGEIAASGRVDENVVDDMMKLPYFNIEPPKTTGRELFSYEFAESVERKYLLSKEDMIATITALSARAIGESYKRFVFPKTQINEIVLGGGGAYNNTLREMISCEFAHKIPIKTHEDFGISNKFKEAIAFALLAYAFYQLGIFGNSVLIGCILYVLLPDPVHDGNITQSDDLIRIYCSEFRLQQLR